MNRPAPRILPILASLAILACAVASHAAPKFAVEPAVPKVALGDVFEVYLTCDDPAFRAGGIEKAEFDADPLEWTVAGPWKALDPPLPTKEGPIRIARARLQGFETGDRKLPAALLQLKGLAGATSSDAPRAPTTEPARDTAATTEPATLRAEGGSVLVESTRRPEDESTELVGLRGPREYPRDWRIVALQALAALGALALAAWLAAREWKRRRARPAPPPPPEPALSPSQWIAREVERSRALEVCTTGPIKAIHTLVADALRGYLARRYGFDAMELTTHEIHFRLAAAESDPAARERARKILDECDLVKFSRFEPPRARWNGAWEDLAEFALATSPDDELDRRTRARLESLAGRG